VAASQRAGRGRQGRNWHSPIGENLYVSVILRPPLPPQRVPPLTLCAGLAICEVVNSLGPSASIKWPNDVLIGGAKVAGVLTEMSTRAQKLDSVVVGIGLNVNSNSFPPELVATSLLLESKRRHELPTVLGSLLFGLNEWYELYLESGVAGLEDAFAKHSMLAGKTVRAKVGRELVAGTVAALGPDGSLIIEDGHGVRHNIIAGEVELMS
jgi:BirA family biotin operon repressor/biotin-[acetyl-CoA-carboxylase] ligase